MATVKRRNRSKRKIKKESKRESKKEKEGEIPEKRINGREERRQGKERKE